MEWWQIGTIISVCLFSIMMSVILWANILELCCSTHWHNRLDKKLNIFGEILFTLIAILIIPLDFITSVIWEILKLGIKK